ncbi:MAG: hypothetical protein GY866_13075, partial [Proteobacteria bacterium]|nr:hypothetical protein [Pseudomonadota bacterium]
MILVEGVVGDESFEKGSVDFIAASDRALDKGSNAELVDASGTSLREVEDSFDGLVGKQNVLTSGSFEVETDVAFRVFEAEGSEAVAKGEAGSQWCEEAELEDLEEVFDS